MFNALADLQAKTDELSMNGDAEKATDIVEKQCDKHFENSKNQEMLALVTELILTKNEDGAASAPTKEIEDEEEVDEVEEAPESKPLRKKNLDNLVGEDMD